MFRRNKYIAIEKTRNTKKKKRQKRLQSTYLSERKKLLALTKREFYLCGLFLYWGEGVKGLNTIVSLNNTDPKVIKFYYWWLIEALQIPKKKIRVFVHLYQDMKIQESLDFWSRELDISFKQFTKPYVKRSTREHIDHKGFGYGTCGLRVCDARLKEKIILGIEAISDYYTRKNVK